MLRTVTALLGLTWLAACEEPEPELATGPPDAAASVASPLPVGPAAIPAPSKAAFDPNPLGLPPMEVELAPHKKVFTFSDKMLAGASEGSTLILYAATAVGLEEGAVIIAGREGDDYRIHPGYVIPVPETPRLRIHDPIVTEWAGVMRHGVLTRFVPGGGVVAQLVDGRREPVERTLKDARIIKQESGLAPGQFAVLRDEGTYRHMLLVSSFDREGQKRWLALGYGGAAAIVAEDQLLPISVPFKAREGDEVWAEWLGTMRPATISGLSPPASFAIKFARAGEPARTGWGFVMSPLEAAPDPAP
jgi:hypothetical protein